MIIDQIYLFKTPLSNNYKNVYDSYEHTHDFLTFLQNNFDYKVIKSVLFNKRSVKTENNGTQISIFASSTEIYENYNYCCIVTEIDDSFNEYEYRFYFISDVVSLSDVPEKESCLLNLEWDSWHNNINKLQYSQTENNALIKRRHFERFYEKSGKLLSNNFYTDEQKVRGVVVNSDEQIKSRKILFLRVRYDSDTVIGTYDQYGTALIPQPPTPPNITKSAIPSQDTTPIIYYPYGIYYAKERVFADINYEVLFDMGNALPENQEWRVMQFMSKTMHLLDTTHILSMELTTFPQINFEIVNNRVRFFNGSLYNNTYIKRFRYAMPYDKNSSVPLFPAHEFNQIMAFTFEFTGEIGEQTPEYTFDFNYKLTDVQISALLSNHPIQNKITENEMKIFESRYHNYPYNYNIFKFGGNIIPIVPDYKSETLFFKLQCYDTLVPKIRMWFDNQEENTNFYRSKNNGFVVFSKDSLDVYLRSNAEQLNTSKLFADVKFLARTASAAINTTVNPTIKNGVSQGLNAVNDAISNVEFHAMRNAMLDDVKNSEDIAVLPSDVATDDTFFQDDIIYQKFSVTDKTVEKAILFNLHYYGVKYEMYGNLFENYRTLFDFVKTDGCTIKFSGSIRDREKIQEIFNNGVTKWHIDTPPTYNENAIKNFDRDYYNLSYAEYDYITSNI